MNLLRRCILPFILASLGFLAIPTTMSAQVTSGEQNSPRCRRTLNEMTRQRCRKKPKKLKPGFTETKTTEISLKEP